MTGVQTCALPISADAPVVFKTKSRLAQEAHEAIRPTNPYLLADELDIAPPEKKLYELIWRRFIASQMPKAVFDTTHIEIEAKSLESEHRYLFASNGAILRFDGFLKIWPMKITENLLLALAQNESLNLKEARADEHQTQPPPRYNEAQLIKALEKYGIGRPSTYAQEP